MTTRRLSPINPLSWPLWLKFAVGILLAFVLIAIPALYFVRTAAADIGERTAESYLSQTGVSQITAISNTLGQARANFNAFTDDPQIAQSLTGFLLSDVNTNIQTYLPKLSGSDLSTLLRQQLLNPASAQFETVTLLDRNGLSLITTNISSSSFTQSDLSKSPAYLAIQSAQLQGQNRALSISLVGVPVIELVNTITWRDGTPLGYVVAHLNNARIFFNNMRADDTASTYQAFSFVVNAQKVLIVPPESREQATDGAIDSPAVTQALNGQGGTLVNYTAADGIDYVGYSATIPGTPLVLVAQAPTDTIFNASIDYFRPRIFVIGSGLLVLLIVLVLLFSQMITPSLHRLRRATLALAEGRFDIPVPDAARNDEVGQLATSFVNMRDQVKVLVEDLENRIIARTRDISATQEISRYATTQRDLQMLMDRVVGLIIERFPNIYHAQIFLIDPDGLDAVLRSSTGTVGQELLSRGHRLGVGSLSVIGQVTQQGRLIIARDAAVSQVHRRNEFLPDTRAELAIPLNVGDRIIGALDVQSKIRDAFEEDQVNVLQTMADQIAIAIENARLFEESVQRFAQIEDSNRAATRRAWQEFMRDQRAHEIVKEAGFATEIDTSDLRRTAIQRGELIIGQITNRQTIPIAVPVTLRGQTLGAVEWEIPMHSLSEERLELAKELANRLALSLDNARLFQESQRAAERERLVNNIATKLTAQTSINDILQTAVREVGQALRAPQVSIRLQSTNSNGASSGDN